MKEKKAFSIDPLISVATCMDHLSFVANETDRRNIAYNLQYLNFLDELEANHKIEKSVRRSFIKTQITVLASIFECFMYDLLEKSKNRLEYKKKWKEVSQTERHIEVGESRRVKTVLQEEVHEKLERWSRLVWMINIAEESGLIRENFKQDAHAVKTFRDKIHLQAMEEIEYTYFTEEKLKDAKKCVVPFLEHFSLGGNRGEIQAAFHFLYREIEEDEG